ncbi:hypothetical protein BDN70DRAFT_490532 [Pholiota conissans]|uniref:Uncharacterized protein n=1 Tax=Pholiota conissans TaxID=109636 RepID=A0A9P6CTM8_9AGAR|nr:hypothetical protein BDN70DRAFT_490532 [Pholiota conissans]
MMYLIAYKDDIRGLSIRLAISPGMRRHALASLLVRAPPPSFVPLSLVTPVADTQHINRYLKFSPPCCSCHHVREDALVLFKQRIADPRRAIPDHLISIRPHSSLSSHHPFHPPSIHISFASLRLTFVLCAFPRTLTPARIVQSHSLHRTPTMHRALSPSRTLYRVVLPSRAGFQSDG